MDTATMRSVDRRLGVPICTLLTAVRRVRRSPQPIIPPRSMAIIKLAEQGATVAAHPSLVRASEMVGRDRLYVLLFAENRPILDELDVVAPANILTVRTSSLRVLGWDLLRAIRRLRRVGVDAVVDFESFSRISAIVSYLIGSPTRVGLHSYFGEGPGRGDLLTHRIAANPHLHAREVFDGLVAAAGRPPDRLPAIAPLDEVAVTPPRIRPTEQERARMRALVHPDGRAGPAVLLNANASDLLPLRRWPTDRYVQLAHALLERRPDLRIVLTGGPSEAPASAELAAQIASERCTDLAGRTSLRELLVLMEEADVLVTNDSGPAHFAGMTGIEAITLFGPETPAVFGPESERATNIWLGLPCSPCVNAFNDRQSACRDNLCMASITVDQVLIEVEAALARRAAGAADA